MNCQEFKLMARDLARHQMTGELLDARLRTQGLDHAAQCAACAARLADERQLSAGLRTWAVADETLGARPQVESALLAAFRQQARPLPVPAKRQRLPRWAWAAAAVLLVSLLSWAVRGWLPGEPSNVQPAPTIAQVTPAPQATPAFAAKPQPSPLASTANVANSALPEPVRVSARPKRAKPRYRIERYLVESEIATDFLPLTDQSTWPRREQMQAVRVQLPRTVLARFGLPMSLERAAEPIQAELLIGADGLTRAIRFIQTNLEEPQIVSANIPTAKD